MFLLLPAHLVPSLLVQTGAVKAQTSGGKAARMGAGEVPQGTQPLLRLWAANGVVLPLKLRVQMELLNNCAKIIGDAEPMSITNTCCLKIVNPAEHFKTPASKLGALLASPAGGKLRPERAEAPISSRCPSVWEPRLSTSELKGILWEKELKMRGFLNVK